MLDRNQHRPSAYYRDPVPPYLLDPDLALAERDAWETRYERALFETLAASTTLTLTAASPRWAAFAMGVLRRLKVPQAALNFMLAREPVEDSDSPEDIAKKLAPTLATAAFNTHVLSQLVEHGISGKMWVCRHDDRVRASHREADGQKVPLSRPFVVGGSLMQYPADASTAPIGEWINDRCTVVGVVIPR